LPCSLPLWFVFLLPTRRPEIAGEELLVNGPWAYFQGQG
jgi:hypothetical protein